MCERGGRYIYTTNRPRSGEVSNFRGSIPSLNLTLGNNETLANNEHRRATIEVHHFFSWGSSIRELRPSPKTGFEGEKNCPPPMKNLMVAQLNNDNRKKTKWHIIYLFFSGGFGLRIPVMPFNETFQIKIETSVLAYVNNTPQHKVVSQTDPRYGKGPVVGIRE